MSLVFWAHESLPLLELCQLRRHRRGQRCTNRQRREIVQTDRRPFRKMTANNLCTDNGTHAPSCGYFSPFWERIFHFHARHMTFISRLSKMDNDDAVIALQQEIARARPPQVPMDSPSSHPSWQKNVTAVSRRRLLIKWPKM